MMILDTQLTPFSAVAEITETLRWLRDLRRNASQPDDKAIIDEAVAEAEALLPSATTREEL